jgi:hypothetical protein
MPEVTRIVRSSYRDDDYDSDDGRSNVSRSRGDGSYRTVQRYRVTPVTSSRTEEVDTDRRSRTDVARLDVGRNHLEVERRDRYTEIERPRSAIEMRPRSTIVERYVERDPIREPERSERTRTVVYERGGRDSDRSLTFERERERARPWESERDVRETDVRIEKRTERRDEPYELDRYTRETEYYDSREPAPIVIRERPREQKIIFQEAPAPLPIVLPAAQQEVQIMRREEQVVTEPRRQEDEYYYRRDVREIGPRRDEDWQVAAAVDRREIRPRDSVSDESDGSDYVVSRKVIRKERSGSHSPHHKRHLAEGALAGAGVAALVSNHRDKVGDGPEHRGRKVLGGAALGAIGAEVITRARSRYRESQDDRSRSRSRSSSRHSHRKLKTGLALAALGLGAAAAAKYVSNRRQANAEEGRGRSRTRSVSRRRGSDDYDDYDDRDGGRARSRSKHEDPKHRRATIAKAGVATAAVAGVVEHFRNKSRKRSGERSKSKLRTGAEIAATGLAGAAVAGLYENRKAKQDREADEEEIRRENRKRSRSRSRARSTGAYEDPGVDPELGMVQYGTEPVYTQHTTVQRGYDYDPALAAGAAGAAYGANREHRSRSHRHRHSESPSSSSAERDRKRSRSRSRVRDIAGAAAGTAAAAIGISQYRKRKEKKEAERERQRRREDPQHSRSRSRSRSASSIRSTLTKRLSNLIPKSI